MRQVKKEDFFRAGDHEACDDRGWAKVTSFPFLCFTSLLRTLDGQSPRLPASSLAAPRHLSTLNGAGNRSSPRGSYVGAALFSVVTSTAFLLLRDDDTGVIRAQEARPASPYEGRNITEIADEAEDFNDQVIRARANPGVYMWGSNDTSLIPSSSGAPLPVHRTPVAHPSFRGWVLRDLRLESARGAAVDVEGNVWEWGAGAGVTTGTKETLRGKNVRQVALTQKKTYAVGRDGRVWEVDHTKEGKVETAVEQQNAGWLSSWLPGSGSSDPANIRQVSVHGLDSGERITTINAGSHHLLALSNRGRCFTLPADAQGNVNGQLGLGYSGKQSGDDIGESNAALRPVTSLPRTPVCQISTGTDHNLVRTEDGRAFGWGGNGFGVSLKYPLLTDNSVVTVSPTYKQLATLNYSLELARIHTPRELWPRSSSLSIISPPKTKDGDDIEMSFGRSRPVEMDVDHIAAGEGVSFLVGLAESIPRSLEVMAAGAGLQGQLGTGVYPHIQAVPAKVRALSNLSEYNEAKGKVVPIRIYDISCGSGHCAATLDNAIEDHHTGRDAVEYGRDVLIWGAGSSYQLNVTRVVREPSGAVTSREKRRTNLPVPTHIDGFHQGGLPKGEKGSAVVGRLQLAAKGRTTVKDGPGRGASVDAEQRIVCGNGVTAVYMKVVE
ncbi:RCC1/BLIP-II protein [Gonapodya prolifera JEL478]|uniref:RCC1/BLIP-II protein n=1 Tax=Gonapodya prolifera (strain JEL478) TaxID=1344416 RepID=A0A139A8B3_GONPJ|nr:RCC1/BLIP-II protein [Gonapodya prolifera JEL478]|eukprot:KXS13046.1 RCC1/BLIP-II protein [Gonapodya prolifera JEL478]